jgi:hypothetical protein
MDTGIVLFSTDITVQKHIVFRWVILRVFIFENGFDKKMFCVEAKKKKIWTVRWEVMRLGASESLKENSPKVRVALPFGIVRDWADAAKISS